MKLVSTKSSATVPDKAEWQVRVDLAAAHRMAVMHGFNEGVFNHLTAAIPGKRDRFLVNPFGLYWSEVTASSLIEVAHDGRVLSGEGECERSAFCIHSPIHRLNEKAGAVLHTHMPFASALTRLENPRIEPIGQTEVLLRDQIVYDTEYTGLANDPEEGERLAAVLGDKRIMFMANHGVLVVAETIAQAYDTLFYLERACQVQLYAMWTGQKLKPVKPAVIEHMRNQVKTPYTYGGKRGYRHHFDALKRVLDRKEPDYKD
ncbi:MAG: aldolase [Alphaproteobacteria bacterium]|nr:aldolase [Alphaproteobacteria bacterium]